MTLLQSLKTAIINDYENDFFSDGIIKLPEDYDISELYHAIRTMNADPRFTFNVGHSKDGEIDYCFESDSYKKDFNTVLNELYSTIETLLTLQERNDIRCIEDDCEDGYLIESIDNSVSLRIAINGTNQLI